MRTYFVRGFRSENLVEPAVSLTLYPSDANEYKAMVNAVEIEHSQCSMWESECSHSGYILTWLAVHHES